MALKLALFGGSFDPPHLGHLAFAKLALEALQPDQLLWLPAGRQWQKADQVMAAPFHRLAMIEQLIEGEPRFASDPRELRRTGPSFTVDTLREFHRQFPGVELLFLLGQDQYCKLHTWYQAEQVPKLSRLVVVPRAGQAVEPPTMMPPHEHLVLDLPNLPISSTQVRRAAAAGEDLSALVGPKVASYIAQNSLYTEP